LKMLLKQQKKVLARHMGNALADISKAGVAIWLDDLSRERLQNGSLKKLIESDYVVGVTTNPSIFASAIGKSDLYQADIVKNALLSTEKIITQLTTDDVRDACDFFAGIYESTKHQDGRVSIEVDPRFARDTNATVEQGLYLWKIIDRPNLLIKVPATIEGLPAITELIERGVSVNVTLIFSVARYKQVLQAYADGLKRRVDKQQEIGQIFSVASFFISRIDSAVDALLPTDSSLRGQTAIANAVMAYQSFLDFSNTPAWKELVNKGANVQRPLWASTGVKDPSFDPNLYVLDLVAPNTVNTMPEATLNSVRNSGVFNHDLIPSKLASSKSILAKIALAGIDLGKITDHLEVDGVSKFESAWLELMKTVNAIVGGSK
jgi:transaldolase